MRRATGAAARALSLQGAPRVFSAGARFARTDAAGRKKKRERQRKPPRATNANRRCHRNAAATRPGRPARSARAARNRNAPRGPPQKKNAACVPTSRPRHGESSSKVKRYRARASVCTLMGRVMARRGRSVRNTNNVFLGAWPLTRAHRGSTQNTAWIPGSLCRISDYSASFGREDSQQSGVCRDAPSERVRRTRACEVTCCAAAPGAAPGSLHIDLRARTLRLPPKKSQRQAGPPRARDDLEGETPTDPERDSAYRRPPPLA